MSILTARAAREIADWRRDGSPIGFTNGCFDIIHAGHVAYLAACADEVGYLVVGLNTDESVRKIKGEGRPICPLEHRMAVLAALSCVAVVVPFADLTPLALIEEIMPDILFKGRGWTPETVVGREVCADVRIIDPGIIESSSRLIAALAIH